ncbi:hypothetical protein FRY77_33325 [Halomonas sp. MG34]|nr:hypothetical protein [Halomonas sp. MG34]
MLTEAGFDYLGMEDYSPGIITLPLPSSVSSRTIGDRLKEKGVIVSYESDYLLKRNWIQFALMGDHSLAEFAEALAILKQIINSKVAFV